MTFFGIDTSWESWVSPITFLVMNIILAICIYTDAKEHKIYNRVTYTGIALGFILNTLGYQLDGFLSCCFSFILGGIFFGVFYLLHGLGGGDVKLILACCVLTNVFYTFGGLIIASIFAAIYAIIRWLKTRTRRIRIPYGVFIGIGLYTYQILISLL